MKQYLELLQAILDNGVKTGDRTGTGTISIPGYFYICEMEKDENGIIHNFPLLTTKRMSLKSVFEELIWKLRGDTNIRFLVEHKNHIWTEWPFKNWLEKTGQTAILKNMWKDEQKSDYTDEWKVAKKNFEERILNEEKFLQRMGWTRPYIRSSISPLRWTTSRMSRNHQQRNSSRSWPTYECDRFN